MPSFFSSLLHKLKIEGKPRPAKIQMPSLSNFVKSVCVPKWYKAFSDEVNGGFYERLDTNFQPLDLGYKRLLTQCRQLYIYVYADGGTNRYLPKLTSKYEFIRDHYYNPVTKAWSFNVKEDGAPNDTHLDLYAHSFLILAFSQYAKATKNKEVIRFANETAELIDRHFRFKDQKGFYEALNADLTPIERMRRQNPHMHLFEACLFAYDALKEDIYARLAHEIYGLFKDHFFDKATGTLREFFENDLTPHKTEGHRVEAGHHFEWVWLLDYYRRLFPEFRQEVFTYMETLYDWGCTHGYDPEFGGIYDEQSPDGTVLKDTKRVWPLCEALKSHRAMRAYQEKRALALLHTTKKTFKKRYIRKDAGWNESWNRDFSEITVPYLPGTSVYHL